MALVLPQVAESSRLFIVASRSRYPHAPAMEPTAMLNPRIFAHSTEVVKGQRCLSIPGIRGWVPRYQAIEIEYRRWQKKARINGFCRQDFQHEYDHLDGIVFFRQAGEYARHYHQEYQKRVVHNEI